MTVKARVNTDAYGNIIVHMDGGLEYENSKSLRTELLELAEGHPACQITLDLHQLDFVGSSGIGKFIETIEEINTIKNQFRLQGVRPEFARVFRHYSQTIDDIIVEEFESDQTDVFAHIPGKRRTFEN